MLRAWFLGHGAFCDRGHSLLSGQRCRWPVGLRAIRRLPPPSLTCQPQLNSSTPTRSPDAVTRR